MPETDELLTVPEAAAKVKVNPETIRRWIKSGKLPAARPFGGPRGPYRIHSADLERLFGASPKAGAPASAGQLDYRRELGQFILELIDQAPPGPPIEEESDAAIADDREARKQIAAGAPYGVSAYFEEEVSPEVEEAARLLLREYHRAKSGTPKA